MFLSKSAVRDGKKSGFINYPEASWILGKIMSYVSSIFSWLNLKIKQLTIAMDKNCCNHDIFITVITRFTRKAKKN